MTVSSFKIDVIEIRSEMGGLYTFFNIEDVFFALAKDPSIWKISFNNTTSGERYRLIRYKEVWKQQQPEYIYTKLLYAPERDYTTNDLLDLFYED